MNLQRSGLHLLLLAVMTGLCGSCKSGGLADTKPSEEAPVAPLSAGATIGIFRPSSAAFGLKASFSPDFPHFTVQFGTSEDLPVVGDWDGTGFAKVGVFRPSDSTFRLLNRNISSTKKLTIVPDVTLEFGMKGDVPIAGDWDGNHTATIGVYRPSESTFYLKNSNTPGKPDFIVQFGDKGDIPVAGDWDGNGTWTVGVYRPSNSTFYLRNNNSAGKADITVKFGSAGDIPVTGDWDGNGSATIGVFTPSMARFNLRNSNSAGEPDISLVFGATEDKPIAGRWSRD